METNFFKKYNAQNRFRQLLRYLHFADNNQPNAEDRLWKIRNVFSQIISKFSKFYNPKQNLVIDDSYVLFKERLSFKQYIPSKRHRFGLKLFVLCDCKSEIILDIIVYSASEIDIPRDDPCSISGAIVKNLMAKYMNKSHILYTDN